MNSSVDAGFGDFRWSIWGDSLPTIMEAFAPAFWMGVVRKLRFPALDEGFWHFSLWNLVDAAVQYGSALVRVQVPVSESLP